MTNFTVLKGGYKPPVNKCEIWHRIFNDAMQKNLSINNSKNSLDESDIVKIVVAGVKHISQISVSDHKRDADWLHTEFACYRLTAMCMELLSPSKLAEIFPASKTYDGERFGCKDYFSAVEVLRQHTEFSKEYTADNFCWEFWNHELGLFAVNAISLVDALNALDGRPSVLETFMPDLPKYYMRDGFFFDETGKPVGKVKKKYPRWIKRVK